MNWDFLNIMNIHMKILTVYYMHTIETIPAVDT